jgi:hypothetical protein
LEHRTYWAFKVGLFLVVLSWFSETIYQAGKAIFNFQSSLAFTDLPASMGLGFRTAASFIALVTMLFFLVKRDFALPEALTSLRWVVLLEAAYWVSLVPAAIWGFQFKFFGYSSSFTIFETALPYTVEVVVMPVLLGILFFKLNLKDAGKSAIKWGLIAAAANILVLWFSYTSQWIADIMMSGPGLITNHTDNIFGFSVTVGGLFILVVYASIYARKSAGINVLTKLNLRRAGIVLTALGLFFGLDYLILVFSGVQTGYVWHIFFLYHNVDLWMVSLPLVGLPLLFSKKNDQNAKV